MVMLHINSVYCVPNIVEIGQHLYKLHSRSYIKVKVIAQGQGHSKRSRSQLKAKVTVLKMKVMDEGQGHEIEGQCHTSKSGHSSGSRS